LSLVKIDPKITIPLYKHNEVGNIIVGSEAQLIESDLFETYRKITEIQILKNEGKDVKDLIEGYLTLTKEKQPVEAKDPKDLKF
jgi:hypothetical protein